MARDHARIFVSIWADPDFRNLDRTEQRTYLMLTSQARLTYCGALDYLPGRLATLAKDETPMTVEASVARLESLRFLAVDRETSEVLIRSFVRHDGLLSSPNMCKAMLKDRASLLSDDLRDVVDSELARAYQEAPKLGGWKGIKEAAPELFEAITSKGSGKGSRKGFAA